MSAGVIAASYVAGGGAPPAPTADLDTEVTADSPYLWWKLDDTAGSTAVDSSGSARDGTYNSTSGMTRSVASIIANVAATCIDPNATSGNYISRATTDLSGTNLTYEMWVRGDAWPAGTPKGLFQYGAEVGLIRAGDAGKRSGQMQWYMGSILENDASDDLVVGHTYHLLCTYNTSTGAVAMWIGGVLVKSGTQGTGRFGSAQTHYVGFNNAAGREPDAQLQYANVYKSVLSHARIHAHWMAGANDNTAAPQPVGTERYATGTAATSHAVPIPYGVEEGDSLVMVVSAAATAACTGWTASETGTAGNGFTVMATLLTKVADATDEANAGTGTFTVTMSSSRAAVSVSAYRGGTIGDSNVATADSVTSLASPTVTAGGNSRIVHAVAAVTQTGAGFVVSPSTSTAHRRSALAAFHTSAISDEFKSAAGTSTSRTHGASGSSGLVAFVVSLDA